MSCIERYCLMEASQFLLTQKWLLLSITCLLGLMVGSFLNVVIYRLPIMIENANQAAASQILRIPLKALQPLSLLRPGSFCQHCKTKLQLGQNIPLISYVLQGGKSTCCKKKLAIQYPIVEILSAIASWLVAQHFGFTAILLPTLLLTWALIALFFIDLNSLILPDELTLSLLWLGIIFNVFYHFTRLQDAILGAICGYGACYLITFVFLKVRKITALGQGDFKLIAALGAWFGWQTLPILMLSSSLVSLAIGLIYLITHKKRLTTPIPFGPFLALSGFLCLMTKSDVLC